MSISAYYYGKKKSRRVGRPPGGHSNLEGGGKKLGRRRKRRKQLFVHKKRRTASVDNTPAGSPQVLLPMEAELPVTCTEVVCTQKFTEQKSCNLLIHLKHNILSTLGILIQVHMVMY